MNTIAEYTQNVKKCEYCYKEKNLGLVEKGAGQGKIAQLSGAAKSTAGNINKNGNIILKDSYENYSSKRQQNLHKIKTKLFIRSF